jgi:hypothetical protein
MTIKTLFSIALLSVSLMGFSQKIKLKKGEVLVDEVAWLKYEGCGMMSSSCSAINLKGDEIIYFKLIDNPFDETMYYEVKFLGMNVMVEFEHTTAKTIFEHLYKGKVVGEDGELDQEKVERFVEKYGTPVSNKLHQSNNNTNTIIIRDESPKSGVNINLGR